MGCDCCGARDEEGKLGAGIQNELLNLRKEGKEEKGDDKKIENEVT